MFSLYNAVETAIVTKLQVSFDSLAVVLYQECSVRLLGPYVIHRFVDCSAG